MRGLAYGGAFGLLWACIEGLFAGSLTAIPSTGFALITCGFAGGALSELVPAERISSWSLGRVGGYMIAGAMLWLVSQWSFTFLLRNSFDLLEEVANVFTMLVFASGVIGACLLGFTSARWTAPAERLACLLPLMAAVGMALFASRVTSFIVGFEFITLVSGSLACCLAAWATRVALQDSWFEKRETLSAIAFVCVLGLGGGLAHYTMDETARAAAWSKVPLTRNLASTFATILDGDVDGIGQGYGHPDCDDISPNVFPGAREIPGNNRDDNCLGGDVSKEEVIALWSGPKATRGEPAQRVEFDRKPYNVLFVTLDAVRADHTSLHGYHKPTTPTLKELGESSLVFESAWSASNFTALSMMSLFTGLYPTSYLDRETIIGREKLTLPAQLEGAGYITEAIVDLHPALPHLYAGFLEVDDTLGMRATAAVRNRSSGSTAYELSRLARQALKRLTAQEKPWFLWVHYSEPHAEYLPHPGYEFGDDLMGLYDGEIAYADQALRLLLNRLRDGGNAENTIVVVTSDHGEAFGEHGVFTHGQSLFVEEVHVPLVIHLPSANGTAPLAKRISDPMDLTDVAPTLLDALGLKALYPMHGESLLPRAIADVPLRTPEAFTETRLPYARLQALRRGDKVVLLDHLIGTAKSYDLATDPGQLRPTFGDDQAAQSMAKWIDLHLALPTTLGQ
jgi:arylsulfatase A-like enzyme